MGGGGGGGGSHHCINPAPLKNKELIMKLLLYGITWPVLLLFFDCYNLAKCLFCNYKLKLSGSCRRGLINTFLAISMQMHFKVN